MQCSATVRHTYYAQRFGGYHATQRPTFDRCSRKAIGGQGLCAQHYDSEVLAPMRREANAARLLDTSHDPDWCCDATCAICRP